MDPKPLPRTSLEPVCEALAGVIHKRRIQRGLSLNRLAELTRLSRQILSYIETNRRVPTIAPVARMDASFGTTPLAMEKAIMLMERGVVNPEHVISHRYPLAKIQDAVATMGTKERNKVTLNP